MVVLLATAELELTPDGDGVAQDDDVSSIAPLLARGSHAIEGTMRWTPKRAGGT